MRLHNDYVRRRYGECVQRRQSRAQSDRGSQDTRGVYIGQRHLRCRWQRASLQCHDSIVRVEQHPGDSYSFGGDEFGGKRDGDGCRYLDPGRDRCIRQQRYGDCHVHLG